MRSKHTFKKQYGQNFLRGERYARELVDLLKISEQDIVVEIGPGDGLVTRLLIDSPAKLVIAVEIDYQLIPTLIKKFNDVEKFELVNQDILQINFTDLQGQFNNSQNKLIWGEFLYSGRYKLKVIGSLPYNISKLIIQNALTKWPKVEKMAFIVQEEVAQVYAAIPPRATWLSNWVRLYAEIKKHKTIPASQFYPQPKVGGGILELKPIAFDPDQTKRIASIVRLAFTAPRKTLQNNLRSAKISLPVEFQKKRASEIDLIALATDIVTNPTRYVETIPTEK